MADADKQATDPAIVVGGVKLSGPNSTGQRRAGRLFLPVMAVTQALGDVAAIYVQNRTIAVRRQSGVTAEFDAKLGQVRENGSVRLAVSNTAEFIFPPNAESLYLPLEILSELLDVSIRFDASTNSVIVSRGVPAADTVRNGAKHSFGEIYQIDYDYGINRYSASTGHNLAINAIGRLGDGRFTVVSGLSSNGKAWNLATGTFTYDRANGQRFVAGDLGTGNELSLLSTNIRGASFQTPIRGFQFTAFAGRTFSGVYAAQAQTILPGQEPTDQPPGLVAVKRQFDTTVFGAFATNDIAGRPKRLIFSGGFLGFTGHGRGGNVASGGFKYNSRRFRFDGNVGLGAFTQTSADGTRTSSIGKAIDFSGTIQLFENLSVQGRYTFIGKNFLSPQFGLREAVNARSAGITWAPLKWLSTSFSASTSTRPGDRSQKNGYVTGTLGLAPRSWLPSIFISHTESRTAQLRSASFTILTATKELSRFRIFLNATRIKTFGAATINFQAGANYRINDYNSIEASQGFGSRGSLNGQIDWRSAAFLKNKLSFTAGIGYTRGGNSEFSTYERITASLKLPRQNTLQLSYTQSNGGPTLMVSLRGSLFRRREAQAIAGSPISETGSLGKISGRVYQDTNLNGKYEPGIDQPAANVQVRVDGNRFVVSDINGLYEIDAVKTGQHQVYINLLSVRADMTLLDGETQSLELARGRDSLVDFRLIRTGRVSGIVWLDANGNGKFDDGETPLAGVRVVTSGGRDTLTDSDGYYIIGDLPPGDQVVLIDEKTLPAKLMTAAKPAAARLLPGQETRNNDIAAIYIPADVKRFPSKQLP